MSLCPILSSMLHRSEQSRRQYSAYALLVDGKVERANVVVVKWARIAAVKCVVNVRQLRIPSTKLTWECVSRKRAAAGLCISSIYTFRKLARAFGYVHFIYFVQLLRCKVIFETAGY